eukprot:180737_1
MLRIKNIPNHIQNHRFSPQKQTNRNSKNYINYTANSKPKRVSFLVQKKKKPTTSADEHLTKNIKRRNQSKSHHKRKPLILPPGLSPPQSPENLAFLASLDSDTTRTQIPHMMKEMDYSLSQIREYYHYQKDYEAMHTLQRKFNEEAWKAVTMGFVTVYGIWVMTQEGFFSNPALLFKEWPQIESWRVFLYYQIATGYHAHRALWQFWEKQRKDAVAMFVHHWVTVCLITTSWYWGIMNNGAVVMVVHDNADAFLPVAKIGRWLKISVIKNVGFVLFVMCWIVSRIGLFTWVSIIPLFKYAPIVYSCHHSKVVWFIGLELVLLTLHLYWAKSILSVAVQWLCCGTSVEDTRSDTEEDSAEIIIEPEEFSSSEEEGVSKGTTHLNLDKNE